MIRQLLLRILLALLPAVPAATALAQGNEGPSWDGAWYDPSHDGEGWIVEVLEDGTAVVYWFTYPPSGSGEQQAWIQGTGQLDGNTIEITESVITRGPVFGEGYDVGDLEAESWGSWTMMFSDCDSGTVSYQGPAGFGEGEFTISRLTAIAGSPCGGAAKADPASVGLSGSWYDPQTDGQGITLEVLPDGTALLYWFTYDPAGNQAWVLGVGTFDGTRFEFPEMLLPVGTVFGEEFDPSAVEARPWGSLSLTVDTCGKAVMNYRSDIEGWSNGWLPMQRLSSLGAHPCVLAPPAALNRGNWAGQINMHPAVSEVAVAVMDGKAYSAGDLGGNGHAFIEFNPQNGNSRRLADLPASRHHAMMVAHDGFLYLFGGYGPFPEDTVWRYDRTKDEWSNFTRMPGGVGASAAVAQGDYLWVLTQIGIIWRFDPPTREWTIFRGPGTAIRDHGNAVVFRGEIWHMAGRQNFQSLKSVDIFDPVTQVWRPGPPLSFGHSGFAAAVVDGQIFVAGGEHPGQLIELWTLESSLEVYAPGNDRWFRGPDLPVPVHGVGGVSINGRLYLLGGSTVPGYAGNPGIIQAYVPGS